MKKSVLTLFAASALLLCSCSGKADKYLDKYEELSTEIVEASKAGDNAKLEKLQEEVTEFQKQYSDINPNEFTPEQKERLLQITTNMVTSMSNLPMTAHPADNDTDDPSVGSAD